MRRREEPGIGLSLGEPEQSLRERARCGQLAPHEIKPKQAKKGGEEVRALADLPAERVGPVIGTFHLGRRIALAHQECCPEAHLQ
jgi:hypothetical protein